ncbi:MAG: hypothetical protein Solumvirus2_43 [Solumvirus sp.]|uniref:Uncharacterized protein n=1 Tax=Solumvirus sp. TaxID=2487773 RepID=A0A3G5AG85_9VIRU|nr:MAG: hypothetical protein Solumvirus2_43 [Solumvirus sp.]
MFQIKSKPQRDVSKQFEQYNLEPDEVKEDSNGTIEALSSSNRVPSISSEQIIDNLAQITITLTLRAIYDNDLDYLDILLGRIDVENMTNFTSLTIIQWYLEVSITYQRDEATAMVVGRWKEANDNEANFPVVTWLFYESTTSDEVLKGLIKLYTKIPFFSHAISLIDYESSDEVRVAFRRMIRLFPEQDINIYYSLLDYIFKAQHLKDGNYNSIMRSEIVAQIKLLAPYAEKPEWVRVVPLSAARPIRTTLISAEQLVYLNGKGPNPCQVALRGRKIGGNIGEKEGLSSPFVPPSPFVLTPPQQKEVTLSPQSVLSQELNTTSFTPPSSITSSITSFKSSPPSSIASNVSSPPSSITSVTSFESSSSTSSLSSSSTSSLPSSSAYFTPSSVPGVNPTLQSSLTTFPASSIASLNPLPLKGPKYDEIKDRGLSLNRGNASKITLSPPASKIFSKPLSQIDADENSRYIETIDIANNKVYTKIPNMNLLFEVPRTKIAMKILINPRNKLPQELAQEYNILYRRYSLMTHEQKMEILMPHFILQKKISNLTDRQVAQIYGPSNPQSGLESDDLLTDGNDKMFCGTDYVNDEDYEDYYLTGRNDEDDPLTDLNRDKNSWFLGNCETCYRKILKRCYAVRQPRGLNGGWLGCYCSWDCVRNDVSQPDPIQTALIDYFEDYVNKNGILDRNEKATDALSQVKIKTKDPLPRLVPKSWSDYLKD